MNLHLHERGVGMKHHLHVNRDVTQYYFTLPNEIFDLGLHHFEIDIYVYLLHIEDRRTYQCIASKLGIAVNTAAKYVAALEEHGLIRTERTEFVTKGGRRRSPSHSREQRNGQNGWLSTLYRRTMSRAHDCPVFATVCTSSGLGGVLSPHRGIKSDLGPLRDGHSPIGDLPNRPIFALLIGGRK